MGKNKKTLGYREKMKIYKSLIGGAIVFIISACLFIGYNLADDSKDAKIKKLEKKNAELIELLKEQTELNDIHSATIEDLNYQFEQYFNKLDKQIDYNGELNH